MTNANALAKDHPLRQAMWIWPESRMYLENHFAHFRKDFELKSAPKCAPFFVTADKAYKLYVNGEYVCRGPARGYQSHWPYDELDLAPYLCAGHNWISVEAYNPGISTFQYIHKTVAFFICAARWKDFTLVSDRSWLMRRSPWHSTRTARLSVQMDFQEHVDGSKLSRDWLTSPNSPESWSEDGARFPPSTLPFGHAPYDDLEPRGIPLLREAIVVPAAVRAYAARPCGPCYREWENVSWGWVAEARSVREWDGGSQIQAGLRNGWFELEMRPAGVGNFRAVTLEMPEYVVGNVLVQVDGAAGGEILDFHHEEMMVGNRPALREPGSTCNIALGNRLQLKKGRTEHEFFHLLGFRYVTVVGRDITKRLTVRMRVRAAGYPFQMRGEFRCSDKTLNDIHSICRRTQQICALDSYLDTPWREQAQWWGDARVQARNTFYLDGDARLLARGIRSIAGQPGPHGLTYGHAPTSAHGCILPDFSLTWILTVWDYYWQTGETDLLKEQWPRIQQVLSYFDTEEARSRQGLLRHDRRYWYFGDWSHGELFKGEVPTLLNLWYLLTLRHLVRLLEAAGWTHEAEHQKRRADAHEALVMSSLFDPERRMFVEGLDEVGSPARRYSVYEQSVALMLGIAPEAHETMIRERLLPYLRGEDFDGSKPSVFWCTYVLEDMGRRGYGAEVVRFIRRKWSPMPSTGTTWEFDSWSEEHGGSISHAWTAHPSYHLVNIVVGITQVEAAWKRVRFSPCFVEGIEHARALIPSPQGDILASWKRAQNRVEAKLEIPDGVEAQIELSGAEETVGAGRHVLGIKLGG